MSTSAHPDAPTKIDEETDNWPVADEFLPYLRQLKKTHYVQPLWVYLNDQFVEPNDVNEVISNSLAEIHFSVKHYIFRREGEQPHDSFNANVEQVIILKRGEPKSQTVYKRTNPLSGLVNVKRTKISDDEPVTSGSGQRALSSPRAYTASIQIIN